jgi:hypothetical protein
MLMIKYQWNTYALVNCQHIGSAEAHVIVLQDESRARTG